MKILDNSRYVLNACETLDSFTGSRVLPMGVACLTGESLIVTSIINLILIILSLYLMLAIFDFDKKNSLKLTCIFFLNALVAFPFFYAGAHSYVYTFLASLISLKAIKDCKTISLKYVSYLLLCAVFLRLTRTEAFIYLSISAIAFCISKYIEQRKIKDYVYFLKNLIILFILLHIVDSIVYEIVSYKETLSSDLSDKAYRQQYPDKTYFAVALKASYDYLSQFLIPFKMSFFGNFIDWFKVHSSKTTQYTLYFVFITHSILSTYLIIKRKNNSLSIFIISLSVFLIPTFLISQFMRVNWYYPSRAYLGAMLTIPFISYAILKLNKKIFIKPILFSVFIINSLSFVAHNFFHFENLQKLYLYESYFLEQSNPSLAKTYAIILYQMTGDYDESIKILRDAYKKIPVKSLQNSLQTFFLWSDNIYTAASLSFHAGKNDVEYKALDMLYANPNYYAALACIQDSRKKLSECKKPELLIHLCDKRNKELSSQLYKKPRITISEICK